MSSKPTETQGATGEWRELTTVSTDTEARLVEGRLENEGIDCQLESLVFTQEPVQFGLLGGVRVHVLAPDLERAQRLLDTLQSGLEASEDDGLGDDGDDEGAPP